ncbi:MAG: hypothetical protein QNJ90_06105 [Planctomycetota bacterium]|nr:hypothetical protein [Planctomycetota bacterium]
MPSRPLITDEPVDRLFSRPVAGLIVKVLAPTRVTANQVTCFNALLGVAIGTCLWFAWAVPAAICIGAYLAFDCVDGQLSRLRGGGGYLGRAMDGWGDYVTAIAVHIGLAGWIATGQGWWAAGALTFGAAAGMAWASFLLDRYKRRYTGSTDDIEEIQREAAERGGFAGRLVIGMLPYAKRLDTEGVVIADRAAYQQRVRIPMLMWLLNGPTMHFTVMAVCCVLARPTLYAFIAVGPMLVVTLLTLWIQRSLETREPAVVGRRSAQS